MNYKLPKGKSIDDPFVFDILAAMRVTAIHELHRMNVQEFKRRLRLWQTYLHEYENIPFDRLADFYGLKTEIQGLTRDVWNLDFVDTLQRRMNRSPKYLRRVL